jgi:hypothetical protein
MFSSKKSGRESQGACRQDELIGGKLQSLISLLHVYTIYKLYALIFTALLHIKSLN